MSRSRRIEISQFVKRFACLLIFIIASTTRTTRTTGWASAFSLPLLSSSSRDGLFKTRLHSQSEPVNSGELMPLQKGSTVALVTPMTETGQIHVESLRRLVQFHVDQGTRNLCVLGTTGEASTMTMDERKLVLETVVDVAKNKIPILVGTGTISPRATEDMTRQALDLGCDAALVVTPYYVKPPQRGLVRHMVQMSKIGLPVVMYNVPGRTGVNMEDASLVRAALEAQGSIAGVKDATGDLNRVDSLLEELRKHDMEKDFILWSGDDATSLDFCRRGGHGTISVTANVIPNTISKMMDLALQQEWEEANQLNTRAMGLHTKLFVESNPMPVKWCAHRMGLIPTPYCRPPLDSLDDSKWQTTLEQAMKEAGIDLEQQS